MITDNYTNLTKSLIRYFQQDKIENIFEKAINDPTIKNTKSFTFVNDHNVNLQLSYPGKKTAIKKDRLVYDYLVSLNNHHISYIEIIIFLHFKARQLPTKVPLIYDLLSNIAHYGYNIDYKKYSSLNGRPTIPSDSDYAKYLSKDNQLDFSVPELAFTLTLLGVEEDINYPRTKNFEGRQRAFDRYTEAISPKHLLSEIIHRSCLRSKLTRFSNVKYIKF